MKVHQSFNEALHSKTNWSIIIGIGGTAISYYTHEISMSAAFIGIMTQISILFTRDTIVGLKNGT